MNGYVAGGYLAAILLTSTYAARIVWRTRKLRHQVPQEERP